MANNFQTVKTRAASDKFNLIRVEPARYVTDSLSIVSGTTYSVTFFVSNVSKVEVNGTAYTLVSGTPSSGEYSFDESTKLLTINLGAALTTQAVVVFYYLFFTTEKARQAPETPTNIATTTRVWQPRLSFSPGFTFNQKDIQNGILSFGNSKITLHNEDSHFEQYLGDNDSWSNKKVTIWLGLDNVENVSLVYRGTINKVSIGRKFAIEYFDEFSVLGKTYHTNGSYLNSTFNSTNFSSLHPIKENTPIRKLYSEVTTYQVVDEGVGTGLWRVDAERLLEATCISFSNTITTSNNREWGTVSNLDLDGNVGDGGLQTDTVTSIDHTDPNFSLLGVGSTKTYRIGDTLEIAGSKHVRVLFYDSGADQIKTTKDATIAASDSITRPGISVIVIEQSGTKYYALYGRDFSISYTGNPNNVVKVTFVNNFEATLGMNPLNPNTDIVRFRAWADTASSYLHGNVIKSILEAAGLTVNASSITTANTDLAKDTNFYIPHRDEGSFRTFTSYIEDILKSTLGYLTLNNDLEIEYRIFKTLSPSNTISSREILLNTFKTLIDYNDLRSSIIPENVHDIIETTYTNAGLDNNKTLYLHGITTSRTYKHVLEDTSRMQKVLDILAERQAFYKLTNKVNPDAIIGDQFTLSRDNKLIGDITSRDVIVVGVDKTSEEITITASDLLGI